MPTIRIRRKILRWGNAYGIRLTKADVEALGLHEKDEASVEVHPGPIRPNADRFRFFHLGGGLSTDHDDVIGEGFLDEQAERRP